MKKGVKLYSFLPVLMLYNFSIHLFAPPIKIDLRFALWIFALIPFFWVITFPMYVIVYFIVTKILFNYYKVILKNRDYGKALIKSIALGFAFDILISIIILFISYFIAITASYYIDTEIGKWWYSIPTDILVNPFWNITGMLMMCVIIFIVKYINYKVYFKYLALWLDIDEEKSKNLALYIILLTAPYFYFIPTRLFL